MQVQAKQRQALIQECHAQLCPDKRKMIRQCNLGGAH